MNSPVISRTTTLFWVALLTLAPLLWLQGRLARQRTPRLPEATGDAHGSHGMGPDRGRLLVVGESPVVGVGVSQFEESLGARIAAALAETSGRCWHWTAIGENGANLQRLNEILEPLCLPDAVHMIVVVSGVNDTTGLTPIHRWQQGLQQTITQLRRLSDAPILFTTVPPMQSFTALPQPLRWVLGLRSRALNEAMRTTLDKHPSVLCAPVLPLLEPQHLASDGFHPSAQACQEWAERLIPLIHPLLR